jgi:hypothetical protein
MNNRRTLRLIRRLIRAHPNPPRPLPKGRFWWWMLFDESIVYLLLFGLWSVGIIIYLFAMRQGDSIDGEQAFVLILVGVSGVYLFYTIARRIWELQQVVQHGLMTTATLLSGEYVDPGMMAGKRNKKNGCVSGVWLVRGSDQDYEAHFAVNHPWAARLRDGSTIQIVANPAYPERVCIMRWLPDQSDPERAATYAHINDTA